MAVEIAAAIVVVTEEAFDVMAAIVATVDMAEVIAEEAVEDMTDADLLLPMVVVAAEATVADAGADTLDRVLALTPLVIADITAKV